MKNYWIWYPGDFEIHEGMLQNFSRFERGMNWPAFWSIDDCYKNVKFIHNYDLEQKTVFTVHTHQQGYMTISFKQNDGSNKNVKYKINEPVKLNSGHHQIVIYIFSPRELPTIYVTGNIIHSDASWIADNYITQRAVGYSNLFTSVKDNPAHIPYQHQLLKPKDVKNTHGGLLVDFGKETYAALQVRGAQKPITICYGESSAEALDTRMCYYQQTGVTDQTDVPARAFRYLFIPDHRVNNLYFTAISVFLPMTNRSHFKSDQQLINKIWNASIRTFKLCSDLFYIDGIKRDRWIWGGDAYQDNFINQYSYFNEDVDKRTIIALRGHDAVHQHINTIVDYSLLWIISIYNHYEMTGDKEFVAMIMPRMEKMMNYLLAQTNQLGFIYGRKGDWIFVDWSEMDKEGTVAAEQMFLLRALQAIITCKKVIGQDTVTYQDRFNQLKANTLKYFWDDKQGAFIDSYESGKHHVTRHANILAILFDFIDKKKQQLILNRVLENKQITQLTTPYFKFFEQDALCKLGKLDKVFATIKNYWGAMIKLGATTIWEEYNPSDIGVQNYAMYDDAFGKSLCHAWGASPVYLLGRYFIGLRPTSAGYATFEVAPHLSMFRELECTLPIKNGTIKCEIHDGQLVVTANREGGTLIIDGQQIKLHSGKSVTVANC